MTSLLTIFAQFYLGVLFFGYLMEALFTPFVFGEKKMETEYTAKEWLTKLILNGLMWLAIYYLIK